MHDLTANEYESVWTAGEGLRQDTKKRRDYYDGNHAIVGDQQFYVDGSAKSQRVSNFVRFGIDLYTGSIAGTPYNLTEIEIEADEGEEVEANLSPERYREIGGFNNFAAGDVENLRNALIAGFGIETHEFMDDQIVITSRDPLAWQAVWNASGELIGLIHRSTVAAGQFVGDTMLDDSLEIMVVYNDQEIITFNKTKGRSEGKWFEPEEHPRLRHAYRRVPAVIFRTNESYQSHISDDLIGQQDEYNEIDSAAGDDIKGESEGVLALKGYAAKDINDNAETIRQFKLLPLPSDGDAFYIHKGNDEARITSRLKRTRENIFMGLAVPDISEIVGATGSTSGIALHLKFKPMADNAAYMIANLRSGIRDRIDLINAVLRPQAQNEAIENVQINIDFSLPVNRVEEWQNIDKVSGVVSHRKQLEMLSDVDDPAQEEARLSVEAEFAQRLDRKAGTDEEIVAREEVEVTALAAELQPQISTVIDAISDAALAETLRRS
jgi:SPP1 family phage portal protein